MKRLTLFLFIQFMLVASSNTLFGKFAWGVVLRSTTTTTIKLQLKAGNSEDSNLSLPKCPTTNFGYNCSTGTCFCVCPQNKIFVNNDCKDPCTIPGQYYTTSGVCSCQNNEVVGTNGITGSLECQPIMCSHLRVRSWGHVGEASVGNGLRVVNYGGSSCTEAKIYEAHLACSHAIHIGYYPPKVYGLCIAGILPYLPNNNAYNFYSTHPAGHYHPNYDMYWDNNCMAISPSQINQTCFEGYYAYVATPVSLLFGTDELEKELSISSFPLEPSEKVQWYTWRASEKAPLLVYDPEHKGIVHNQEQLFGGFTFGPAPMASLSNTLPMHKKPRWKHGFEALSSLDTNNDGKISDTELNPLALWFDRNRDGATQKGEVQPISDKGIVALYYEVNSVDEDGNLWAYQGYERLVDGKIVAGRAVDWLAHKADSKYELLQKHLGRETLRKSAIEMSSYHIVSLDKQDGISDKTVTETTLNMESSPLHGVWRWQTEDTEQVEKFGGYLAMTVDEGFAISGTTLSPQIFSKNSQIKEKLSAYPITGHFAQSGKLGYLRFTTPLNNKGLVTETTAELVREGYIKGRSQVIHSVGKSSRKVFAYNWIAEKENFRSSTFLRKQIIKKSKPEILKPEPEISISKIPTKPKLVNHKEHSDIFLTLHFDTNSFAVNERMKQELKTLVTLMEANPNVSAVIEGHTDNVGTRKYNYQLSKDRASAVETFLVSHFGISPSRLRARGYGFSKPIANNNLAQGRLRNRRVIARIVNNL